MSEKNILAKQPCVSVVIPTYNRAHLLKRSVGSVLAQSYKNFEIIIVDDFSTDDTQQVVMSMQDSRIRYIRLDQNYGGSYARNVGIRSSNGLYIAFQDSDDEWCRTKLQEQIVLLENSDKNVGLVYTGFNRVSDEDVVYVPSGCVRKKQGDVFFEIIRGNFVGTPTVLIRKKCFDRAGYFDVDLPRLQDWDLFIRVSMYYKFLLINKPLVLAHHQSDSISANKKALITAYKIIISKYFFIYKLQKNIASDLYVSLSRVLFEVNDSSWRKYIFRSLFFNIFNIRALFVLFFGFNACIYLKKMMRKINF